MILHAKYLMPHSRLLIENGAIAIRGSEIVDVGRYGAIRRGNHSEVRDLGKAVLMPGLVNAHTHLELTHHKDLVQRTARFTDWILELMQNQKVDQEWVDSAVQDGIGMSLAGGATTAVSYTHLTLPTKRIV